MIAEPPSRLTYEIVEGKGVCTVTITHDVTGARRSPAWCRAAAITPAVAAAGRGSSAISSRSWKRLAHADVASVARPTKLQYEGGGDPAQAGSHRRSSPR